METEHKAFNANEWSILIGLAIGLLLVFILPKRFPKKVSLVFFTCGVYSGFFFDNSFTLPPFDLYDVNDTLKYEVMDYVLYVAYGPISFLFFYVLDYLGLTMRTIPLYVFGWACMALSLERLCNLLGIFRYLHGYQLAYSLPIYLLTFSCWLVLYAYYRHISKQGKSF